MRFSLLVTATTLILGGCFAPSFSHQARSGVVYPPNPEGCPVSFVYQNELTMAEFESLGTVTLAQEGFSDSAKEELAPITCKWGGDTVTIQTAMAQSTMAMQTTSTFYTILRRRDPDAAKVELACSGTFVNSDGASLAFNPDLVVAMTFGGNAATCEAIPLSNNRVDILCNGARVTGNFAADCSNVNYNGLEFHKQ